LKKLTSSVRFYKPETEKIKPNPNKKNRKKISQIEKTEPNRKKPSQTRKTKPNQFEHVFVLKNRTKPKTKIIILFNYFF